MKTTNKAFFLTFAVALAVICGSLSSCGGSEPEEILRIVAEQVEASLELNKIYFGEGLPPEDVSLGRDGYLYVAADAEYSNIEEIKKQSAKVFTPGYCRTLFEGAFTGYTDDNGNTILPRYTMDDDGWLMVYEEYEPFNLSRKYLYETIRIDKVTGKKFTVTIDTQIDGNDDIPITLDFFYHEGAWLLDSPTY